MIGGRTETSSNEGGSPIERIGFVGIDLGLLAVGRKVAQFRGGPLPNQNLVKVG
jgi:8-hydroxy-5-deazaflavin:NADPH oxidoreductase